MRIAVIGAGHAGIEAALTARAAGADVAVFSSEAVLPYFRPRLVAVACGQSAPEAVSMHPLAWYDGKGVRIHLDAPVILFDPESRRIVCRAAEETFNGVVLACGAMPVVPRIDGHHERMPVFTLWSMADALALRQHIRPGARLTVVGGGVIGLEAALRAVDAGARVSLIEKMPQLMCGNLGMTAAAVLSHAVQARGVRVHCGHGVGSLSEASEGVSVNMDERLTVAADVVLLSIGACPNRTLAQSAGLATDRGVLVDDHLQTAFQGVFAAGDVAQAGRLPRCSVKEAVAHGRLAGANAVAAAAGQPLQRYVPSVPALTMKVGAVEVHLAGVPAADGDSEERLDDATVPGVYRGVVRRAGSIVGVQMVGSREGFDDLAGQIR
jgi:NAD(P)H-nitrite reductase large subunit